MLKLAKTRMVADEQERLNLNYKCCNYLLPSTRNIFSGICNVRRWQRFHSSRHKINQQMESKILISAKVEARSVCMRFRTEAQVVGHEHRAGGMSPLLNFCVYQYYQASFQPREWPAFFSVHLRRRTISGNYAAFCKIPTTGSGVSFK